MMKEDAWVVFRLSTTEKMSDQEFEYSLILEDSDGTLEVIDILKANNQNLSWLEISYEREPVDLNNTDISIKCNLSLLSCCFLNIKRLLETRKKLSHIYFWTIAKQEMIYLEVLYPLSEIKNIVTKKESKFFLQLYPQIPSEDFEVLEDNAITINSLAALLDLFNQKNKGEPEPYIYDLQVKDVATELSNIELNFDTYPSNGESLTDIYTTNEKYTKSNNELSSNNNDLSLKIFSKQDLKDLEEGFNEWQRAHGKNELIDKLPESLINKISTEYEIVFWTSGQGVSNMVRDNNPPRHTMVLSIIQKSSKNGIGYCIQRPTSLDKVWTHKQWHKIKYSDSEILEVSVLEC